MTGSNAIASALLAAGLFAAAPGACALDANVATAEELQTIRGIGPAISARIVEERKRAPFSDLDDLGTRVRGVGAASLRRMRDAGLEVGASGRVETVVGRPRAAAARRDEEAARRVQTFVGTPSSGAVARAPAGKRAPPSSKR